MVTEQLRDKITSQAAEIRGHAYAPQSGFCVGAVVLANDGTTYVGVNVENSSYGLTCCAERTALFAAISAGQQPNSFEAIAIASDGGAAPCGACRQVIVELAEDATLFLVDANNPDRITETTIKELLPRPFKLPPRF